MSFFALGDLLSRPPFDKIFAFYSFFTLRRQGTPSYQQTVGYFGIFANHVPTLYVASSGTLKNCLPFILAYVHILYIQMCLPLYILFAVNLFICYVWIDKDVVVFFEILLFEFSLKHFNLWKQITA